MSIFAISDLHLSFACPKEMDIFGPHWEGHFEKIKENWLATVKPDDIVLIPGDLSWAMRLEEAMPDIDAICSLPGKKILIKGNHDYWWSAPSRVRAVLKNDTHLLQYDSMLAGGFAICGSRGWILPADKNFTAEDRTVYEREKIRLRLSLDSVRDKDTEIIVMMHYPPVGPRGESTEFSQILAEYPVRHVVFGHIHSGESIRPQYTDIKAGGIVFNLVSCDYLDFKLKNII
ncbi:MAG: metallophosphoesterase [Eubacteriales bacterium]